MKGEFISSSNDGIALIHSKPYTGYIDEQRPTLVFSMQKIRENHDAFRQVLNETFVNTAIKPKIFFSMKTNPHPEVLKSIKEMGCGIQVVSGHELDVAAGIGFDPRKIILGGLGKDKKTIETALKRGIHCIYLDSLEELQLLHEIDLGDEVPCKLGIITSQEPGSKIGICLNEPEVNALRKCIRSGKIKKRLKGLHYHGGTQIVNEKPMLEEIGNLLNLSRLLEKKIGTKISSLNLGGGFPEASYLKIPALKRLLEQIRNALLQGFTGSPLELVFEPGRFLVADAGIVICRANQVKKPLEEGGKGDPWLMLSAGINVINPISKARTRFLVANRMNDSYNTTFNICGSLPTRMDIFTKHYPLPSKTSPGDDVLITNAGAYTIPFLMNFCLEPPKITIINQD